MSYEDMLFLGLLLAAFVIYAVIVVVKDDGAKPKVIRTAEGYVQV